MLRAVVPALSLLVVSLAGPVGAVEPDTDACPPVPLSAGQCAVEQGTVSLEFLGACEIYMQGCGFRNHGWLVAVACTEAAGYLALSWQYLASDAPVDAAYAVTRPTGNEECPFAARIAKPVGGGEISANWECFTAQAVAFAPVPTGAASRTGCLIQ